MIKKTRGTNAGGTALKILIIEDEQLLADSIAEVLRRKGFEAEAVYDGETGAEYAELGVYDLLILDVMMPGLDGYTVARQVRARHLGTPILMLTARSGLEDRITGLNAGADYYLTKPFDTRELLACVNALLRRQGAQVNQLTLGNTSLDLSTAALSCGADSIRLSAREFDIMRLLLQAGERNLSKAALLERVWGYDSDAVENHVEVYVCFLRKKLASIGSNIRIESIRRLGYHIEDEQLLADSIAEVLRRKGFEAEAVYDGETGAEYAELGVYDLLILDVMMPGLDGYTVARQVRARHLGTPILMLTARSGLEDRITGLNAGADYYLTKPFDTRELLACVNALLRRQGAQVNQLTLGNTSLDLSTAALSCGADSIRLSAREFDIMRLLLQAGERNLSKAALLERVWGYDSDAVENHVEVYVCFLRKKLASIGSNIRIESIRRLGYHLEVSGDD